MSETRAGIIPNRLVHESPEDIRIRIVESKIDRVYDVYVFVKDEHIAHVIDGDKESAIEALTTLFGEGLDEDAPEEYLTMLDVRVDYIDVDKEDIL